jgi:hypothetical protein
MRGKVSCGNLTHFAFRDAARAAPQDEGLGALVAFQSCWLSTDMNLTSNFNTQNRNHPSS